MKNIFHIGRGARDGEPSSLDQNQQGIAATSWNFQAAALRGGAGSFAKNRSSGRAFRMIGKSFFDVEAKRHGLIESSVFGLIGAFSVWPIITAAQALFALIK